AAGVSTYSATAPSNAITQRRATAQARKYATTTYPFVSVVPQANQAMRSVRVKAIAVPTAMKPSAGRGAKPKRRPCRSSFTGGAMLAARRTLRRFRHSAAGLAIVATTRLSADPADRDIPHQDGDPLGHRQLAPPKVFDPSSPGSARVRVHVRTIARWPTSRARRTHR